MAASRLGAARGIALVCLVRHANNRDCATGRTARRRTDETAQAGAVCDACARSLRGLRDSAIGAAHFAQGLHGGCPLLNDLGVGKRGELCKVAVACVGKRIQPGSAGWTDGGVQRVCRSRVLETIPGGLARSVLCRDLPGNFDRVGSTDWRTGTAAGASHLPDLRGAGNHGSGRAMEKAEGTCAGRGRGGLHGDHLLWRIAATAVAGCAGECERYVGAGTVYVFAFAEPTFRRAVVLQAALSSAFFGAGGGQFRSGGAGGRVGAVCAGKRGSICDSEFLDSGGL